MRRGLLVWLILMLAAGSVSAQMAGVRASPMGYGQPAAAGTARSTNGQPAVNLDLKDVDVRAAIETLFRNTGKNFSIDGNVTGTVPAVSFKDVPFDTALRNLTKTVGLVYRVDGSGGADVYIVSKKPEQSPTLTPPPFVPPPVDYVDQPTQKEVLIEKIPLFHTSASEMLAMLGSGGREYGGLGGYGMGGYGMAGYGTGGYGMGNYGTSPYGASGYGNGYNSYPGSGGVNYGGSYGYGNNNYSNYNRYGSGGYNSNLGYGNYGGVGSGYGYRAW